MPSRARLVRPDFFTDETIGKLSHAARLMYVGTWTLADDDGYLDWSLRQVALELFGYDRGRDRLVARLAHELVEAGRITLLPCGRHARVPTLERHRQKGGSLSFAVRDRHLKECPPSRNTDTSVHLPLAGAYPDPEHEHESESLSSAVASPSRAKLPSDTAPPVNVKHRAAPSGNGAIREDVAQLQSLAEHLTGRTQVMANVYGGLGAKAVADLLDIHGLPAVDQAWRESHRRHGGRVTLRQLVFEADDALNEVARPSRRTAAELDRDAFDQEHREIKRVAADRAARRAAEGATNA
jgi:hypothetical protein